MLSKQLMVGALAAWLAGTLSGFGEDDGPSNAFHRVLEGTVGKDRKVRMVLERRGDEVDGFYYDKEDRELIQLDGEFDSGDGEIRMVEARGALEDAELLLEGVLHPGWGWIGGFDEGGVFAGRWKSADGKTTLPFSLREVTPEGVLKVRPVTRALRCEYVHDGYEGGLRWSLEYVRFVADGAGVESINQWIRSEMLAALMGYVEEDEAKAVAETTDESIENTLRGKANQDALEMTGFGPEVHVRRSRVAHNADGVVCLEMMYRDYEGGAHSEGGIEYVVFDGRSGKPLRLKDVLKNGYQAPLARIGERILREQADPMWPDPRAEAKLSDHHGGEDNWFVTVEGLGFSHSYSEIGGSGRGGSPS